MTNVSDMTDQQLNIALAELTGFPIDKVVPNYCNDPAASLEVQEKAIGVKPSGYVLNLEKVKWGQTTGWKYSNKVVAQLMTATPRQRAEAAYITLSGVNADGL